MLNLEDRVCSKDQQVAAKVMDGEAILINLSNGLYYSMGGIGGFVWALIENRHSLNEIADALADQFGADREQTIADVQELAAALLAEDLIAVCDGDAATGSVSADTANLPDDYAAPKLQKYDDMADMFALDPPLPGLADAPVDMVPKRSED